MTNANIQFFDNIGNQQGSAASVLRSAAEMLEINYTVGETNIFGNVETQDTINGYLGLAKNRAADMVSMVATALRAA